MPSDTRSLDSKLKEKKAPLSEIAKDILKAAVDMEVFNISELARRSKHSWDTTKRLIDLFMIENSVSVAITKAEVPSHYKIVRVTTSPRGIDKEKTKQLLDASPK